MHTGFFMRLPQSEPGLREHVKKQRHVKLRGKSHFCEISSSSLSRDEIQSLFLSCCVLWFGVSHSSVARRGSSLSGLSGVITASGQ